MYSTTTEGVAFIGHLENLELKILQQHYHA